MKNIFHLTQNFYLSFYFKDEYVVNGIDIIEIEKCKFHSAYFKVDFLNIPEQFKKSLTYDRGSEMSQHKLFTKETKIKVFFADPHSPWQRGTNENTNGLIRQYFPKGTDFKEVSVKRIKEVENKLNARPRKTLGYYTPAEKFYELINNQKFALVA